MAAGMGKKEKRDHTLLIVPGLMIFWVTAAFSIQFLLKSQYTERYRITDEIAVEEVRAQTEDDESGFEYYQFENGEGEKYAVLSAYKGEEKVVRVPDAIEGVRVTGIGETAFCYNDVAEKVILPDTVESIADFTFGSCSNLKEIVIPASVTSIGEYAIIENDNLFNQVTIVTTKGSMADEYAIEHSMKIKYMD